MAPSWLIAAAISEFPFTVRLAHIHARMILPLEGEGWVPVAEGDWEDGVTNLEGGDDGPERTRLRKW